MESCFHDRYRECDEEAHLPGDSKQSGNKEMSMKTILYISKEVWEWVDVFTISNGASPTSTLV